MPIAVSVAARSWTRTRAGSPISSTTQLRSVVGTGTTIAVPGKSSAASGRETSAHTVSGSARTVTRRVTSTSLG